MEKKECITSLEKKELKKLYDKLRMLEELSWNDFNKKPCQSGGLCIEERGTENYELLKEKEPSLNRYFHFRIDGAFRVFGGQEKDLCCILFFDPNHKTNK